MPRAWRCRPARGPASAWRARGGPLLINDPRGLRDANEKLYALNFARYMPRTLVSSNEEHIFAFVKEVGAKVDIQAVPSTDFFKQFVNVGNFDMTGFRWLASATPLSDGKGIYYLDPASTNQNYGRIGSEEVNKLLDQANAELDDAKRAELRRDRGDVAVAAAGHRLPAKAAQA